MTEMQRTQQTVWIIEYGAYSNRFIDSVFTTRELAIEYLLRRHKVASEAELVARERATGSWGEYPLPEEYELWDVVPHANAVGGAVPDRPLDPESVTQSVNSTDEPVPGSPNEGI